MKPYFDQLFKRNVPLAQNTTFRIGGPASHFCISRTTNELMAAVEAASDAGLTWQVIGEGSNILASDEPIDKAIIAFLGDTSPTFDEAGNIVVSGGTSLSRLVKFCTDRELEGLEALVGIPGTVGGAIAGNAGAYGMTISSRLHRIKLMDRAGMIRFAESHELEFDYRTSCLKASGEVVLEATFRLTHGDGGAIRENIARYWTDRESKHPDYRNVPTAGSFFKNLPPPPGESKRRAAGEYLEQVGAKELRVGDAGLWHKHANIVVNHGHATAKDVLDLTSEMARRVYDRFDITLEREVSYLK